MSLHSFTTGKLSMLSLFRRATSCTMMLTILLASGQSAHASEVAFSILEITGTHATSGTSKDGSISINLTGGTLPYYVGVGNATPIQLPTSSYLNFDLGVGYTSYTIHDSSSPTPQELTVVWQTIVSDTQITNIQFTPPTICNSTNGSLLVYANTSGVKYSIVGGSISRKNTTGSFHKLPPGHYTVTASTGMGVSCLAYIPLQSYLLDITPQITDIIATPPSCGATNGTIYVSVTEGAPPYTYSITGPVSQSATSIFQNYLFQGLPYGEYNVSVVDGCGLAASSVTSTSCAAFNANYNIANPNCTDQNGTIEFTNVSSPGGKLFSYILNGITEQASPLFTGLAAGTYTIQIKDIDPSGSCYGEVGSPTTVVLAAPTGPDACNLNATAEVLSNNCLYTYTLTNPSGPAAKAYTYTLYNVAAGVLEVQGPTTAASVTFSNLPELPAGQVYTVVETEDPGASRVADQPTSITFGVGTPPTTSPYPSLQIKKCLSKKDRKKKLATGDEATFKITVTNTGTGPASTVQVTDTLPSNLVYVPCESTGPWTITVSGQTITALLSGSLDAGESSSFKLRVKAAKTVTNEATVTAFQTQSAMASACVRLR